MKAVIADVVVLLGLVVCTLAVTGVARFPDVYTQLHAAGKAAFLGVSMILLAAALTGGGALWSRVVLIAVLLTITSPVAAHVVGQAAHRRGERVHPGDGP